MRRLGVVLVGFSLWLPGTLGPATAAERPPKVTPKDLPFTAAVAVIYPDLEGGSRFVTKQAKGVLLRSTEDCVETVQVARADRGTRADFFLAGDLDETHDPREVAALALRLTDVLAQIDQQPTTQQVSVADEIANRRAARRRTRTPNKARAARPG